MTDAELVHRARAGQADALTELVHRWSPRVLAVCHARMGRSDIAYDLAQDTFVRALRALHTLHDPEKIGPWLLGIAYRACLDWIKAREQRNIPFSALGPDRSIDDLLVEQASNIAIQREELRQLMSEVERLPESHRRILMLFYYDDMSYREIAQLLGVSTATVNAKLTYARNQLRQRLCDCERTTHGV